MISILKIIEIITIYGRLLKKNSHEQIWHSDNKSLIQANVKKIKKIFKRKNNSKAFYLIFSHHSLEKMVGSTFEIFN